MPALLTGLTPIASGYSCTDPGGVMLTEVDGGFGRVSRSWDRGTQRYKVSMQMDDAMFSQWITFYHLTIKKGAIAFTMPLDTGFGVSDHSVNIIPGSYSASLSNVTVHLVSFVVEAVSQAYDMTYAEAVDLIDIYETYLTGTDALLARIAQFATVDTLVL